MRQFKNNYTQRKQLRIRRETMERLRAAPAASARPGGRVVEGVAEAETFGVEWVKKWLVLRNRLVEIAKVLRRFP
jgi:hypothetical protein